MSEIVDSGGNAANPRTDQIVDVPAFVPDAPTVEEKATPASVEQPAKAEEATTAENDGQSKEDVAAKEEKKRNGFKEKLERERARAADLEAQVAELTKNKAPEPADKAPKPEEFETWDDYYKASAKYEARQEFASLKQADETRAREESLKTEFADKQKQYAVKADEFKGKTPDFDEVINSYDGPLTPNMQQVLLDSDLGPQIAYYVAQNPEEGEAMAKMGVVQLSKYVGRLEAKLESSPTSDPKPAPKTTKAPPPISPVGKSSTASTVDPYNSPTSQEDWKVWRAKQK